MQTLPSHSFARSSYPHSKICSNRQMTCWLPQKLSNHGRIQIGDQSPEVLCFHCVWVIPQADPHRLPHPEQWAQGCPSQLLDQTDGAGQILSTHRPDGHFVPLSSINPPKAPDHGLATDVFCQRYRQALSLPGIFRQPVADAASPTTRTRARMARPGM